jgi:RsiW-degrading membrane proteinase PrsW (M82 family)
LLGGFLVVGITQEFLKYVAMRFSVFEGSEFNERTDGIVYGTAAGLGYATVLNTMYIVGSGGVDLGLASINVTLTALAHAGFGGIIGYFLIGQKLHQRPVWWSAAGVAIAAATNSVFQAVRGVVVSGDLAIGGVLLGPWIGLLLAAAFSAILTLVLFRLNRRGGLAVAGAEEQP